MNGKTPHIVQYQGSKRLLARQILRLMPQSIDRLVEPFAGMAAITIAAAQNKKAANYYINDLNAALVGLLREAIECPDQLVARYATLWAGQFDDPEGHVQHFYAVREDFNKGLESPENMLYLLARCVKGAVRYGKGGQFNQSPDKRRHGTRPENVAENVRRISSLLKNKVQFSTLDYREVFETARKGDLFYMDPPYQGVTNTRDQRYYSGVDFKEFVQALDLLNRKNIDYMISYDGACAGKEYGRDLPVELNCQKILLKAGRSSQATLLGRNEVTFEALYLSPKLKRAVAQPLFPAPPPLWNYYEHMA